AFHHDRRVRVRMARAAHKDVQRLGGWGCALADHGPTYYSLHGGDAAPGAPINQGSSACAGCARMAYGTELRAARRAAWGHNGYTFSDGTRSRGDRAATLHGARE